MGNVGGNLPRGFQCFIKLCDGDHFHGLDHLPRGGDGLNAGGQFFGYGHMDEFQGYLVNALVMR